MYAGYRVKINGSKLNDLMVARGSYSFVKAKRNIDEWEDANGSSHYNDYDSRRVTIQFNLREMTMEEHESVKDIFGIQDNVPVEYWDDYDCEYKTGTFRMDAPTIKHINAPSTSIRYSAITVKLVEY